MNKSESHGRIRQVAIVLSSVDATTARHLLGQLPAGQARLVRQQMAALGKVTAQEREAASKMLAQLTSRAGVAAAPTSRDTSSQSSPAEALLSSVSSDIDSVELTPAYAATNDRTDSQRSSFEASQSWTSSKSDERFVPVQNRSEYPFQNPTWIPAWQNWSGGELARLLVNERPTLTAAVLLQAPAELGAAILQSLPSPVATAVLATLPQLHATDPTILQDVYAQLHQRLADFQRQSSPENAGMQKLQAILATISSESRQQFEKELATAEPLLAHALGLPISGDKPSKPAVASSAIDHPNGQAKDATAPVDVASPVIVRFPNRSADKGVATDHGRTAVTFEQLRSFSREDFAMVLRSVDPQTILLAISGASRDLQQRFEELVDPSEIKRLRAKLKEFRNSSIREKQSAQKKIEQAAHMLIQQGRLASATNRTDLVAA